MDESIQKTLIALLPPPTRGYWCWQHYWPSGSRTWCDVCEDQRPKTKAECEQGHFFMGAAVWRTE